MISPTDYCVLLELDDRWKWMIRDEHSQIFVSEDKPSFYHGTWDNGDGEWMYVENGDFYCIDWLDEEPHYVPDLIKEYEFGKILLAMAEEETVLELEYESEETEVKKDKKWLVDKLTKERNETDVHNSAYQYLSEFIEEVKQLDELEVLSQEWIDEHAKAVAYDGMPDQTEVVYVDDLQNLLVTKQEKIKVPDWFAEWCKGRVWGDRLHEGKEFTRSDVRALVKIADGEDLYGLTPEQADEIFRNFFKYLDAFFYGYEVEEGEQKYIVKLPLPGNKTNDFAVVDNYGDIWIDDEWPSQCKMTEKEIKALPKGEAYFEHFAVKVEEMEE